MSKTGDKTPNVLIKLIDAISNRITWLDERDTPHKHAVKNYIEEIEKNESLSVQTKAVLIHNSKRDIRRWSNTESICEKAEELINPGASVDQVNPDWMNLFMEKAANISTEEMQKIWAHILAQECNEPNSIPKALLQTLEAMEKKEADDFMNLAAFCLKINEEMNPLVIRDKVNDYYASHGLALDNLHRLETIGLINLEISAFGGIAKTIKDDDEVEYFAKKVKGSELEIQEEGNILFGCVTLSFVGKALIKIITPNEVEGFFETVALPYLKGSKDK